MEREERERMEREERERGWRERMERERGERVERRERMESHFYWRFSMTTASRNNFYWRFSLSTASRNGAYIKGGAREPKILQVPGASSLEDDAVRLLDFDPEGFRRRSSPRPSPRRHSRPRTAVSRFFLFPLICTAAVYYRAGPPPPPPRFSKT